MHILEFSALNKMQVSKNIPSPGYRGLSVLKSRKLLLSVMSCADLFFCIYSVQELDV